MHHAFPICIQMVRNVFLQISPRIPIRNELEEIGSDVTKENNIRVYHMLPYHSRLVEGPSGDNRQRTGEIVTGDISALPPAGLYQCEPVNPMRLIRKPKPLRLHS